jgi:methyl-accepting chemotaxis protein
MSLVSNISIRGKVVFAFSMVLLFAAGLGGFALTRVTLLTADSNAIIANVQAFVPLGAMASDGERLRALATLSKLATTPAQASDIMSREEDVIQDYNKSWASYAPTMDAGEESTDGNAFNTDWGQITGTVSQINAAEQSGDAATATSLIVNDLSAEVRDFRTAIQTAETYQTSQASTFGDNANAASQSSTIWIWTVLGLMLLGTIVIGWLMVSSVATPIAAMTAAMRRLADHDLKVEIPGVGRKDEIGAMAGTVQVFKDNGIEKLRLEAAAKAAAEAAAAERARVQAQDEAAAAQQAAVG